MKNHSLISEYLKALENSDEIGDQVVFHKVYEKTLPAFDTPHPSWPEPIARLLEKLGINRLFAHQVQTMNRVRKGVHTVVATQTASGKTLTYTLPMMEAALATPSSRALLIYPLKALAQDQCKTISSMTKRVPEFDYRVEIYDGDTSAYRRKKIRDQPPHVLITNPEMIHLSILPYHDRWAAFLSRLQFIVVDEVHTYRGVVGSHMAIVFRRLLRMCRQYGAAPTFVFTSATISNPGQLAHQLTGLPVETVAKTTAGRAKRHLLLMEPVEGPLRATVALLKSALARGIRTIVYTQSRKLAELLAIWVKNRSGPLAHRISAYRAGFLPQERREIEAKLISGELLGVISTSALELGIDIGNLDLCLLVGYPGSIVSTLQRGGRVGRNGQESAVVLIAAEDALDRYFISHPEQLVTRAPESAVINPDNAEILSKHLVCAAAELPLKTNDPLLAPESARACAEKLTASGELFLSSDGGTYLSPLKMPHRKVNLRGSGTRMAIIDQESRSRLGEIDGFRMYRETHPGAIYLHKGETFRVEALEPDTGKVHVVRTKVRYHTRSRSHKDTQILEIEKQKTVYGTWMAKGRLRVSETVTGYDQIQTRTGKVLNRVPLDLPPLVFETQGLWFAMPDCVTTEAEKNLHHVMGGLHAVEHGAIGVFPLLVMTDRNDLGGISTPFHPRVEEAAIFIYDGVPGGANLCAQAFSNGTQLIDATLSAISNCPCENGCPSCVHSPKCGSGNRPIDKAAALFLLQTLIETTPPSPPRMAKKNAKGCDSTALNEVPKEGGHARVLRYGVLDIETQLSAKEVGGWHRAHCMRVSCAVLYDSQTDDFFEFVEGQVPMLLNHLRKLDLVIGFNIKRFDYRVLGAYTQMDFGQIPTLDILEKVKNRLGYRLSLDHLATATLDAGKTADGLDALRWWKEGKMSKIIAYCRSDVAVTRDLYQFGRDHRYLLFQNKAKQSVRLPVDW